MGLECKHFNKIKKKTFKVASADIGLCRQDKKNGKKIDFFFKVALMDPVR
jgi:hypothetical protein